MSETRSIQQLLNDLAAQLPRGTLRSTRVLSEVENHLNECAEDYRDSGMSRANAEQEAVRRFGTAEALANDFSAQSPLEPENETMIRFGLSVSVMLTSLYAVLHVWFSLMSLGEEAWMLVLLKVGLGSLILLQGGITLGLLWTQRMERDAFRLVVFVGGIVFVSLGSSNAVWAAHLGLVTGDWEYYGILGGAMLVAQGAFTAWIARPNFPESQTRIAA